MKNKKLRIDDTYSIICHAQQWAYLSSVADADTGNPTYGGGWEWYYIPDGEDNLGDEYPQKEEKYRYLYSVQITEDAEEGIGKLYRCCNYAKLGIFANLAEKMHEEDGENFISFLSYLESHHTVGFIERLGVQLSELVEIPTPENFFSNSELELLGNFISNSFEGQFRKDGSPLVEHSLRVFYEVWQKATSKEVALAALFHDTFEDLKGTRENNEAEIMDFLKSIDGVDANYIFDLIQECSYKSEFYSLPKDERKARQIAIWEKSQNKDAILIKVADIIDNLRHNPTEYYKGWAVPLLNKLEGNLK